LDVKHSPLKDLCQYYRGIAFMGPHFYTVLVMNKIKMETLLKTQQELSELIGCPGREDQVRSYIRSRISAYVDSVEVDSAGNLTAIKRGTKKEAPVVLLDAHMDEVGFMVNHIEADGLVRVSPLGGIDPGILPGTAVQFVADPTRHTHPDSSENPDSSDTQKAPDTHDSSPVRGTFGSIPPHAKSSLGTNEGNLKIENLTIDIGAASDSEARDFGIDIGSTGTFFTPFQHLGGTSIMGKAFDNRSGCTILLHTAAEVASKPIENTVIFLFSASEEHKQLGADSIDVPIKPSAALVLENTTATDTTGTPERFKIAELGKGPAVTIADTKYIVPQKFIHELTRCAEAHSIPWQYKKPVYGGTNAAAISTGGFGIPTGIVSVPCRYIHSPASVLRVEDLKYTAELVYYFVLDFSGFPA